MATYNNAAQRRAHYLAVFDKNFRERKTDESKPLYIEMNNWKTKEELDEINETKAKKFSWFPSI